MKIDKDKQPELPQGISRSSSSQSKAGASDEAAHGPTDATDKVELSSLKYDVERLKAKAKEIPEVDEAKVARIKKALESGTYNVDSKAVARSILRDHLADETD